MTSEAVSLLRGATLGALATLLVVHPTVQAGPPVSPSTGLPGDTAEYAVGNGGIVGFAETGVSDDGAEDTTATDSVRLVVEPSEALVEPSGVVTGRENLVWEHDVPGDYTPAATGL